MAENSVQIWRKRGLLAHVMLLQFKAFQFFPAKLSISFLPSHPFLFCQAKYFCQGGDQGPPRPSPRTPINAHMSAAINWFCWEPFLGGRTWKIERVKSGTNTLEGVKYSTKSLAYVSSIDNYKKRMVKMCRKQHSRKLVSDGWFRSIKTAHLASASKSKLSE